jgi:hypothetical protein
MNQECTDEFLLFLWGASRVGYGNQLPANGSFPGSRTVAWDDDGGANNDDAGGVAVGWIVGAQYRGDIDSDGGGR